MPLLCRIEPKSKAQKFQNSLALPFEQVLATEVIQQILEQEQVRYRQTIYTPVVTLWVWLSQVLDADKSLSHAVSRVIAWVLCCGDRSAVIGHRSLQQGPPALAPGCAAALVGKDCPSNACRGQGGGALVWSATQSV